MSDPRLQEAAAAVQRELDAALADEPAGVRLAAFLLLTAAAASSLGPGAPCPACGQRPGMQTGEYPCSRCGEPVLHDEPEQVGIKDRGVNLVDLGNDPDGDLAGADYPPFGSVIAAPASPQEAPESTLRRALLLACERIADGPQEYHEANTAEGWAAHCTRQAQM